MSAFGGSIGEAGLDSRVAAVVVRNRLLVKPPKAEDPLVGLADAIHEVLAEYETA